MCPYLIDVFVKDLSHSRLEGKVVIRHARSQDEDAFLTQGPKGLPDADVQPGIHGGVEGNLHWPV